MVYVQFLTKDGEDALASTSYARLDGRLGIRRLRENSLRLLKEVNKIKPNAVGFQIRKGKITDYNNISEKFIFDFEFNGGALNESK